MLKIEIGGGRGSYIEADGSAERIAAEIGTAVSDIYNLIRQNGAGEEDRFKMAMMVAMLPMSPVWEKKDVMTGAKRAECAVMTVPKERKE